MMQLVFRTYYGNKNKSFELRRPITVSRKAPKLLYTNITANLCILLSYHLETESGNFFLIQKGIVLVNVIIDDLINSSLASL